MTLLISEKNMRLVKEKRLVGLAPKANPIKYF
jgi:hypothetical protein